ncbi:MAG: hypothetical protein R3C43_13340 [Chloroflexota bacterium]
MINLLWQNYSRQWTAGRRARLEAAWLWPAISLSNAIDIAPRLML